jgi:hypothetical protein
MRVCRACGKFGQWFFPLFCYLTGAALYFSNIRLVQWFFIFEIDDALPSNNEEIRQYNVCHDHCAESPLAIIRGNANYYPGDNGLIDRQRRRKNIAVIRNGNLVEPTFPTTLKIPDVRVETSTQRVDPRTIEQVINKLYGTNDIEAEAKWSFVYFGLDERFLVELRGDHVRLI